MLLLQPSFYKVQLIKMTELLDFLDRFDTIQSELHLEDDDYILQNSKKSFSISCVNSLEEALFESLHSSGTSETDIFTVSIDSISLISLLYSLNMLIICCVLYLCRS